MTVQQDIEQRLGSDFSPAYLQVLNESHQHSVPPNSETHFKVTLVSEDFHGLRKVARHQRVYGALADLLAGPAHALALHTYTLEEWRARQESAPDSPECRGGSRAGS